MTPSKLLKKVAREKGKDGEIRIINSLENNKDNWPQWIIEIREATKDEDKKGCDIVVKTDIGKLYLQVKSSWTGVKDFNSKRRSKIIATILSRPEEDETKLFNIAIKKLSSMRKEILERRNST
jgi:hypothetical protein